MKSIKKTIRVSELRDTQIQILCEYLKSQGHKGSQTEVLERAIGDMYWILRRQDYDFFERLENELIDDSPETKARQANIRRLANNVER